MNNDFIDFKNEIRWVFGIAVTVLLAIGGFVLSYFQREIKEIKNSIRYTLQGWTKEPHPKWTSGHVSGWFECDLIPYRLIIENSGPQTQLIISTYYFLALMSMCRVVGVFGSKAIPSGNSTASSRLKSIKKSAFFFVILPIRV